MDSSRGWEVVRQVRKAVKALLLIVRLWAVWKGRRPFKGAVGNRRLSMGPAPSMAGFRAGARTKPVSCIHPDIGDAGTDPLGVLIEQEASQ